MKRIFTTFSVFTFLSLLFMSTAFAQDITVKGVVRDGADQQTIPGVSVQVKGTTRTVQTDAAGNYSIEAPGNATLVFTYVGMAAREIPVNNQTTINVTLSSDAQDLEAVVVVGYGTQRKRDLTGSITSVSGEDIAKQPNVNPISSLQGKVAGLTVVNSGSPGQAPTVRIRGVNSTTNANPTYVVDGVIQSNIDYLNPNDIESIEVLKDPSSTAIFGVQGGNGVIVVTTKRAAKGQSRISFQSSYGLQHVNDLIDVTDAAGFKKLYTQQIRNLGDATFDFDSYYSNYTANTNWQDLVLKTASINNNNLTLASSGEKSTTLISLGYNNQEGVLANSRFQKLTGRINQELNLTKNLKVGADINGFHYIADPAEVSITNALWAAPMTPVQFDENTYYRMPLFQRAQVGNPIADLNRTDQTSESKGYRFVGNIFAELKLLKRFTWRSAFYTDLGFNGGRNYSPLPFRFINLGETPAAPAEPTLTDTTYDNTIRTSISQNEAQFRKFQQDHTLTFDSTFNNKHKVTALAGFSTLYTDSRNLSGSRRDTVLNVPNDPDLWYLGLINANNPISNGGGGSESAQMSYFGRLNYVFDNKYIVNTSIRFDGISKFAPENRWGTFGSLGLGWVVTEEDFLKNVKALDFLKLKGSWGTLGNAQGFAENLYLAGLNTTGNAVFGNNVYTSVGPAYVPDPNLHWEVIRGLDLGFESKFLNYKLSLEATYYDRTTKDILTSVTLPGLSIPYRTNLGTISNKGVEVAATWSDKIGNDFTYSLSPNFSFNKNKVESIGDNFNFQIVGNGGTHLTTSGQSIGYFYGYKQVGIYQSLADLERLPAMSNSLVGDIAYEDTDGDGTITPADRTYLGSPFPEWNYGINLSFGYKGFDLLLEGQGVAGNYVYTQRRTAKFATLNYETNRLNAWNGAGSSNVEPILDNTRDNNFLMSTYYLEPGDYFRLRTVQLGYNFNNSLLTKIGMGQLRVYVSGQNIQTWSKTTGYTPEAPLDNVLSGGIDNGFYPVPSIYTFGLNATF